MAIVVLSFTGSEEEITAGIPQSMTIESNVPATIYFTLDGTTPTLASPIYIDTFAMPDGETSVSLSAFGIDADGYSGPIMTQVFAPDQTRIDKTRHVGLEGVVVDRFTDPTNIEVGYTAIGVVGTFSDIPRIDLREIRSSEGRLGIAEGTVIEIGTPPPSETPYPFDNSFQIASSPSDDPLFNPLALTITNDHRQDNPVQLINRPFGSMRNLAQDTWGHRELATTDSTYVSGGFIRRFYAPNSNTMGSYYFDHNTSRWVIGLQELPEIPQTIGFNQMSLPLVFRWIEGGRHSVIPI